MIKIGVIGLNHGLNHIKNILLLEGVEISAISCKTITKEKEKLAEKIGVKIYNDYKQMICENKMDGVIVCAPNIQHFSISQYCAQHEIDILVEKPIAGNLKDAYKIANLVEQYGINVLVGHHRRFSEKVNLLRNFIISGEIGVPIGVSVLWAIKKPDNYFYKDGTMSWQSKFEMGGGPILINAIHEIDTLRYIFGDIDEITGFSNNLARNFDVEDSASICIKFKKGVLATIFLTDASPSSISYENTVGENPLYQQYDQNCSWFFGTKGTLSFPMLTKIEHEKLEGWQYPVFSKSMVAKFIGKDPLMEELKHFCNVIRKNEKPLVTPEDAAMTLEASLKLRRLLQIDEGVDMYEGTSTI